MSTETLTQLIAQAQVEPTHAEAEAGRQMQVCNACRYCESYCAVFPAMTRRLEFAKADLHYLANLCHNCGACLHACQYAPPHEFAINIPQAMAQVRGQTYADYAWPPALGALYARNGLTLALALAGGLAVFLALAVALAVPPEQVASTVRAELVEALRQAQGERVIAHGIAPTVGNFYAVFPHNLLVAMFAPVFLFVVFALGMGVRSFWRDVAPPALAQGKPRALAEAAGNALSLKFLGGGHGLGCNEESDRFTLWRKRWHHATFYGFMLCFASTSVATLYHYALGQPAPYAFTSLPVLLGMVGGIGLLLGPAGLLWLNLRRHPAHGDAAQQPMDRGFIALLLATSATGLALLLWRDTSAMRWLLAVHLGVVMALFVTLPYGKFAHGVFRCAALVKFAIEKRQASRLRLGDA